MPPITWRWLNWKRPRLENKPPDRAEDLFRNTLALVPEPGITRRTTSCSAGGPTQTSAEFAEARKDNPRAIAYYTQVDPTTQGHGNLLRARDIDLASTRSPRRQSVLPPAPPPGRSRRRRATPAQRRALSPPRCRKLTHEREPLGSPWMEPVAMRILIANSFPIPGDYDGTAMLPIKILRALKPRGVQVVVAHLRARPPWGIGISRGEFEDTPVYTVPPAAWLCGSGLRKIARRASFRAGPRPALRRCHSRIIRLPALSLADGL